jgi:hypothetical protein
MPVSRPGIDFASDRQLLRFRPACVQEASKADEFSIGLFIGVPFSIFF